VTADLHFGLYPTGDACTLELARFVADSGADALIIAGDVAKSAQDSFAACLNLFSDFGGARLLVPGNHDLWTQRDGNSRRLYRDVLPGLASESNFHMLDAGPWVMGRTAFVGNIGWYDYSMANPELNLTRKQYSSKKMPGICTWNDLRFIRWNMQDEEFTANCCKRMQRHYKQAAAQAQQVIAVLHHLPFSDLVYGEASAALEFSKAFMGSVAMGELLTSWPTLRYAFCGHRHGPATCTHGPLRTWCVGSTYMAKRLIELDLATGLHKTHIFETKGKEVQMRVEEFE